MKNKALSVLCLMGFDTHISYDQDGMVSEYDPKGHLK